MTRHLVIAGTGRAGTSFLVRLLGDAGLNVGDFPEDAWNPTYLDALAPVEATLAVQAEVDASKLPGPPAGERRAVTDSPQA